MLSVQPLEQKRTARGAWTKGRVVALSRLFGGPKPTGLTAQDQTICAAIEREGRHYYNTRFRFNTNKLLLALVGHPLLFLEKSPTVPVEVVKGEPEVLVTRADADLLIRFSMEVPDARVVLVQETPTRFKVVELSEHHLRIAGILGEKGLKVPASAAQEVMDAVASISSQVTVHSAIGGMSPGSRGSRRRSHAAPAYRALGGRVPLRDVRATVRGRRPLSQAGGGDGKRHRRG